MGAAVTVFRSKLWRKDQRLRIKRRQYLVRSREIHGRGQIDRILTGT